MPARFLPALLSGALLVALVTSGCGNASSAEETASITLDSRADSMAMRIYEAHGGPAVWRDTPALVFSFAGGRIAGGDTTRQEVARHWWRRTDGSYRVEWSSSPDSSYTATFNVNDFDAEPLTGQALLNGAPLDSAAEQRALRQARTRFSNDTYWLLAPLKLFNDGVNRSMAALPAAADSAVADSAAAAEGREALHLTFGKVGLTPEDEYWLTPDSTTGRLARWVFHLQGMGPEQPPGVFRWSGYRTFSTPAGTLTLSTRKENTGGPSVLYTDEVRTPTTLPDSLFSIGGS